MKTKKLLTLIAVSIIAVLMLVTCKKDDFKELVGTCPQPKVEFTIQLSSNPLLGGTTIGDGTFPKDSLVTVAATPNAGYTFTNWTNEAVVASTSSSYTFSLIKNTVLVANFTPVVAGNFAVTLSSNPLAGGTTTGGGSFLAGSSVTINATPNANYTFVNWTKGVTVVSITPSYTFTLTKDTAFVANFLLNTFTLNVTAVNGSVVKNPDQPTYNGGDVVQLTATPAAGYQFDSWSGDALGTINPTSVTMDANKNVTANFSLIIIVSCPTIVDLGLSGNFVIFAESGISTTGVTLITGDMGVNPVTSTSITGFGLILPAGSAFSTSSLVVGNVYAPDYAVPTPANMVTTSGDMHTAFTTANGLVVPAPVNEFMAGNLNGQTLTKGIYKWSSGVSITNGIVLDGGGDNCATFIFQIAQDLTVANGVVITLQNGAQAKNIFWVVAGSGAVLGTNVDFSGNILCKTLISVNTGSKVLGRLLAQTAVTLNAATVTKP
jgi:uncharacterized repeat protein (TIGR02543 family)